MTSGRSSESIVEALVDGFASELGTSVASLGRFGTKSLGYQGAHDGTKGVQWNVWQDHREDAAFVGVNLEGMAYEGWPIARFLEREIQAPQLFSITKEVEDPAVVQAIWFRDAWQVSLRPVIAEKHIGVSRQRITDISPADWRATLLEALECLDASKAYRGRGRQFVSTERHGRKEYDVSPHLQFRQQIHFSRASGWAPSLAAARKNLDPLHRWVNAQSQ